MENQDKKRELIIEAALKRFAHFGLAKTTMTEIASDLSLSKALLYYYFPDKINLYAAVLERIIDQVEADMKQDLETTSDSKAALNRYLEKRHFYIKKYYNIFEFLRLSGPDLAGELIPVLEKAKKAEIQQITFSIKKGNEKGEFTVADPEQMASLLFDAFIGMRVASFHQKKQFMLEDAVFEEALDRQKQLGEIFLNGLKKA
ncbi:TetR/AcrR family transcriptional regulator [Pedobacter sp. SYSU D00535]|uniref:TetR/AcrR family transcriptional regulator n=1 Tax=Pedobacter sp. SYSU D00535 TaxID=2810308 RepID=UPI001A9580EB|nr:TetR/AcrR family transcriptional regulator [Pedobacter sp. SYSU D00535]